MPSVSVIIPTFNRIDFLREALESVLNQTFDVSEIILINDGSDEAHSKQVEALTKLDQRIVYLVNESNRGVSYSRNRGVKESTGDYICFLDDDDTFCRNFIKEAVNVLSMENDIDAVFGDVEVHQGSDMCYERNIVELLIKKRKGFYNEDFPVDLAYIMTFCPMINTFLFRKEAFRKHQFTEDLNYGEDILLWLEMVSSGISLRKLDLVAAQVRIKKELREYSFEDHQKFYVKVESLGLLKSGNEVHLHLMRRTFSEFSFGRLPSLRRLLHLASQPFAFLKYLLMNIIVRGSAKFRS